MLAVLGAMALVLVAGAPWVPPGTTEDLRPPQDVEVYIMDNDFALLWSRNHESASNVTFSAEYQTSEMDYWVKLPGCQDIVDTKCNFSSPKLDVYEEMKLRIRAEKGNHTSSWNELDSFILFDKARVGPPEVHVEAEDRAAVIHISHPGRGGSMWALDNFSFRYYILIWENPSGVKKTFSTDNLTERIFDLLPETTYCLEVKAVLVRERKNGAYSPVVCLNTTVENMVPAPENVQVYTKNSNFVLKWTYAPADVTFRAQWLPAYSKRIHRDDSDKWKPIPACENVRTTHCTFPQDALAKGNYFIRVQASNGNNTSFWSKEIRMNSEQYIPVLPPAIVMKPSSESLHVSVSFHDSTSNFHSLTYEIIIWKNTSNTERRIVERSPEFTIADLQPLTVYCVRARVLIETYSWNKSSGFSDAMCEETKPGEAFITIWIAGGLVIASLVIPLVVCALRSLLSCLNYVFFPSLKPPSNIAEYFSEPSLKNLLLLTTEEQTEKCFIIENTDSVSVKESTQAEDEHKTYASQTSQDSGHYSNEDENAGSETSE
uniref:Interferon alpha/beta receptor 1 n=1 Tax=Jaculus jaculus TaxID=51337 RepID=A0A8C5KIY9_JACJA